MNSTRERASQLIVVIASLAIGFATLRPLPGVSPISSSLCVFCGQFGGTDFVLNVILFVPLGIGLGLTRLRGGLAAFIIVLATVCVEMLQFRFLAGRDASLGDIIANSAGGALGIVVARSAASWMRPSGAMAFRLAAGAAAVWLAVMGGTSWLLTPSIPHLMYGSQWQPHHREFFPFGGRLIDLSMNGARLEQATMIELRYGTRPLSGGVETVSAVLRPGPPTPSLAPIARLGQSVAEAFLLAREGDRLAFRTRLRAGDARLRVPMLALDGAFGGMSPDDTVRAVAGHRDGVLYARVELERESRSRVLPLTPGLGWALLLPFNAALGRWSGLISALWLFGSLVPLSFWGAAIDRYRSLALVMFATAVVGIGLVILPMVIGARAAGGFEFAGAAAGLICGATISRSLRRAAPNEDHKPS